DLADRLRVYGWQVPAYALPANCEARAVQRILVRHGVSRDLAASLLGDFQRAIAHLERHPVSEPLAPAEASGFHH
ncbi:MAG: glutamate decarboxylase, partial [Rhodobacteraceae bacterium]|nr:glutamate decarboxylase [Paracoccaceae bacterium]